MEKVVFSFSLYGSKMMYTEGMIANATLISKRFPDARIQIYITEDVPQNIVDRLSAFPAVRMINAKRLEGSANMFDRFLALDDPDADIVFSRDADSRVHERDASCIEDFIASDKLLHIIRDHRYHGTEILGGMWGMRRKALQEPIQTMIKNWQLKQRVITQTGCDQDFLRSVIYPKFCHSAFIQDRFNFYRHNEHTVQPFRIPIINHLFVGQVHQYNDAGVEYLQFMNY
jgi:hypothetical protein